LTFIIRSARGLARSRRLHAARMVCVLAILLGVPALAVFCWHLADSTVTAGGNRFSVDGQPSLAPRAGLSWEQGWPGQSGASARPFSLVFSAGSRSGRILVESNPGMRYVQRDLFLEALASGEGEGRLVLQGRSRGIPTYAPPAVGGRTTFFSDRAILREIRRGMSGSYTNLLKSVFGTSENADSTQPGEEAAEDNPFAPPADPEAATPAPAPAVPEARPVETKAEPKPANETKPTPEPKPAEVPPPVPVVPLVTTVRPDVMLQVDQDGKLIATPAARLNEQTYETAESGAQRYNVLTFTHPAEIPAAIASADFNSDGLPDVCFVDARTGLLRLFYGDLAGAYAEAMRIEIGGGPRSLAAGDFDGDGRVELAISNLGVGTLSYIYLGSPNDAPSFRSLWIDSYRDYIAASDTTGSGVADVIGMNFTNAAEVLDSIKGDAVSGMKFGFTPALDCRIATFSGRQLQLNGVLLGSNLTLNLQNVQNQLTNVINVQTRNGFYIIVGDLTYNNSLSIALATLRK
jgi:hypothetical protein